MHFWSLPRCSSTIYTFPLPFYIAITERIGQDVGGFDVLNNVGYNGIDSYLTFRHQEGRSLNNCILPAA